MSKKYRVWVLGEVEGCECVCETDSPRTAIRKWFEKVKKHPMMVSIDADNKQNAEFLIQYAHSRQDEIKEFHEKYSCKYKLEYLLEQIQKKFDDKCEGFLGYGDQIHPFSLG